MMLPPRPLPLTDRLYLRYRHGLDGKTMDKLERTGLDREEIVALLERLRAPVTGLSPRTALT
mgnify:CR=1 FL=1|uniref:Uncharacterized protein n=1 Tax=candidate division WOR-3 bacterium TaxID=2052148 RepID=A0A7C4GG50_UNCW3